MVGDLFGGLGNRLRERFEDLPPVDLDGYLADQGRNFLQATDERISRLGLPDFIASSTQKIQGLQQDASALAASAADAYERHRDEEIRRGQAEQARREEEARWRAEEEARVNREAQEAFRRGPVGQAASGVSSAVSDLFGPSLGAAGQALGGVTAPAAQGAGDFLSSTSRRIRDLEQEVQTLRDQGGQTLSDAGAAAQRTTGSVFDRAGSIFGSDGTSSRFELPSPGQVGQSLGDVNQRATGALNETAQRYQDWRDSGGPRPSLGDQLSGLVRGFVPDRDAIAANLGRQLAGQPLAFDPASRTAAGSLREPLGRVTDAAEEPFIAFAQSMGDPNAPRLTREQAKRLVESTTEQIGGLFDPQAGLQGPGRAVARRAADTGRVARAAEGLAEATAGAGQTGRGLRLPSRTGAHDWGPFSGDNPLEYTAGDISRLTDRVFTQQGDLDNVEAVLPGSRMLNNFSGYYDLWAATHPDLALGQGHNAGGVLLEFATDGMRGSVNTSKPAWAQLYDQGLAEVLLNGRYVDQPMLQRNLRAVTVPPEGLPLQANIREGAAAAKRIRLTRELGRLEREGGWTRTVNPDGSVTLRAPDDVVGGGAQTLAGRELLSQVERRQAAGFSPEATRAYLQALVRQGVARAEDAAPALQRLDDLQPASRLGASAAEGAGLEGGLAGGLRRLATEEEGGLRLPFRRTAQQAPQAPTPPPIPNPTTAEERAINHRAQIKAGQAAADLTPERPPPIPKESALATFDSARSEFRERWTDELARLLDVQNAVARRSGKPLPSEANVYRGARLYAGRGPAYEQWVEDGLVPALRGLSEAEVNDVEATLEHLDDIGRGKAIANRVTAEAAGKEVGPVAGETALRNTQQSLRLRRARLGEALKQQDAADQAYRDARAELSRVRAQGRQEVRGSRGRGRPQAGQPGGQRTPAEQARIEAEVQQRVDDARKATVDARTASRAAAKDANVNLSKVTRADLKRMRLEAETEAARIAKEADVAEQAATKGAEAQAARRYSGGVTGVDYEDQAAWAALEDDVRKRLGPGASEAEVQEAIGRVRTAVEGVQAFSRALRARKREAGTLTRDLYERWERDFPNYIRTNILERMAEEGATGVPQGAQKWTVQSLVAGGQDLGARMTEEGTHALRERPLAALIRDAQGTETLARRNEIAQTLEHLINLDPEGASSDLAAIFRKLEPGEAPKPNEVVFGHYKDGEPVHYAVDKRFEGLFNLQPDEVRAALQTAGKISGKEVIQSALTTYNPAFWAINAMKDHAVLVRREATSPLDVLRVTGQELRAARDIAADRLGRARGRAPSAATADLRRAIRAGGGQERSWANLSPREVRQLITRDPSVRRRVTLVQSARQAVDAVGQVMREIAGTIETAPRLTAYRRAIARGADPADAALWKRDISLDFSRGGRDARKLNAVVPFFNAAIQGSARFVGDDLVNRPGSVALQFATLLGAKLALDRYNESYGEEYADVPDYLKDSGIILMLPGDVPPEKRADGQLVPGGRNFLYYPFPQDLGAILRVGTQVYRRATGTGGAAPLGTAEGNWGLAGDVLTAASPVNLEGGSLLPPLGRQVVEQLTNRDLFRDRAVVPDYLMQRPPEAQYTPQTSALGRVAGEVGRATGLPISPARTDYAVSGTLGGTGRQILGASDLVARALGREDLASRPYSAPEEQQALDVARGVPLVGGVVGALARQSGGQLQANAQADLAREITEAQREARDRLERNPAYARLPQAQRDELLRKEYDRVRRQLEGQARDRQALEQARRLRAQR